jgi:hypothetical protein
MKAQLVKRNEDYLISSSVKALAFLSYQTVYCIKNGEKFLKSFNIVHNGKTIRKFYLEEMMPLSQCHNPETIILQHLFPEENAEKTDKKTNSKKKTNAKAKPDSQARQKAASDLFSHLGL